MIEASDQSVLIRTLGYRLYNVCLTGAFIGKLVPSPADLGWIYDAQCGNVGPA